MNQRIDCFNNNECGNEILSGNFCIGKNIFKNMTSPSCLNPGKINSRCINSSSTSLVESCPDLCINGECRDVACYNDFECNDNNLYTLDSCINPGLEYSYCQ